MIEHAWTVACARSIIDSNTNTISLMDVLEEVQVQGSPPDRGSMGLAPMGFDVVSLWSRVNDEEAEMGRGRLEVYGPSDQKLAESIYAIDLTEKLRCRGITRFGGIPVLGTGRLNFVVSL